MNEKQTEYTELVRKASSLEHEIRKSLDLVLSHIKGYEMCQEARKLYNEAAQAAEEIGDQQEAGFMRENADDCDKLLSRLGDIHLGLEVIRKRDY
ncbi:MAG: hypothetical protein WC796_03435 [Candidatus Pacearchaeota archaeon]|jgi:hypothetical protein